MGKEMKQMYDVHVGNEIFKHQNLKYNLQLNEVVTFKKNPQDALSATLTVRVVKLEPARSMIMNTQLWVEEIKNEETPS